MAKQPAHKIRIHLVSDMVNENSLTKNLKVQMKSPLVLSLLSLPRARVTSHASLARKAIAFLYGCFSLFVLGCLEKAISLLIPYTFHLWSNGGRRGLGQPYTGER